MTTKLPTFLIVGSTKAGTTSIYNYLQQHPNLFINGDVKESNFFIEPKDVLGSGPRFFGKKSYAKTFEDYQMLFDDVDDKIHIAIGEVCTTYLHFSKEAIPNIKKYLGSPKIIIILRNPVERAYSSYMHNVRDGDEPLSFENALEAEFGRKEQNLWLSFRLKELGNYSRHVENYIDNFEDVKIIIFEDMKISMQKTLNSVFDFLKLDPMEVDLSQKFNISGIPESRKLHNIIHGYGFTSRLILRIFKRIVGKDLVVRMQNNIDVRNLKKPEMKDETRKKLERYYYKDVKRLSEILNIDLNRKWNIIG